MAGWLDKLTKVFSRASNANTKSADPAAEPPNTSENLLDSTSLSTKTASMREIWRLLTPYFMESEEKGRARARLASIVALTVATSGSVIYFNHWANDFITAGQALLKNPTQEDRDRFNKLLEQFALLTAGGALLVHARSKQQGQLKVEWNSWMLQDRMNKILSDNVNVRLPRHTDIENPVERMRYSILPVTNSAVDLGMGLAQAAIQLPPFAYVLWNLSGNGDLSAFGHTINVPGYLMWGAVAYAGVGATLAAKFGKPLHKHYDDWSKSDTELIANASRIHAHAKSIALYNGEAREKATLHEHIDDNRKIDIRIKNGETLLSTLRKGDADVGYAIPYIASVGFLGNITKPWGDVAQAAHAFSEVQGSLRWYFNERGNIARFRSMADTIIELDTAIAAAAKQDRDQYDPDSTGLRLLKGGTDSDIEFNNLTIYRPGTDTPLLENFTAKIEQGSRVIVMAPTGWGKSTLINTLAGHGDGGLGSISLPDGPKTLILPQGRFIPPLTLREILAYPEAGDTYSKEEMTQVLADMGLNHLIPDLDKKERVGLDYERALSGGEAQRLTFARTLLAKPDILITDEITSALDSGWEKKAYTKLIEALPYSTIISISHREGLIPFHDTIAVPDGKTLKFTPVETHRTETQTLASTSHVPKPA